MKKTIGTTLVVLVVLLASWLGVKRWIESTPEFAMYQGLDAIQHQNVAWFKTVVDLDAVTHAWVQQHVKEVCKPDASESTGAIGLFFSGLFRDFSCEMADRASNVIEPGLKGRILSRIEAGNLAPATLMQQPLHPYWGTLGIELAALIPISPSQNYRVTRLDHGDLVTLQVEVLNPHSRIARHDIGLQKRSSGWKVITYASTLRLVAVRKINDTDAVSLEN